MEFFFLFLNRWSSERNVKLYIAELRRRKAKANYYVVQFGVAQMGRIVIYSDYFFAENTLASTRLQRDNYRHELQNQDIQFLHIKLYTLPTYNLSSKKQNLTKRINRTRSKYNNV